MTRISGAAAQATIARGNLLLMPIGLPGSGKSSLAADLDAMALIRQEEIVSTDAIRLALGGRRDWLANEREVFTTAEQRVAEALERAGICYMDATNLVEPWRERLVSVAKNFGIRCLMIRFLVPPEVAWPQAGIERFSHDTRLRLEQSLDEIDWDGAAQQWVTNDDLKAAMTRGRASAEVRYHANLYHEPPGRVSNVSTLDAK